MTDLGALMAAADAERDRKYAAEQEWARANNHIRKRAGRNLGNQFYSHSHRAQFRAGYVDPMTQTLCGGTATTQDMSWADTRWPKQRDYVACSRCIEIRCADPKAVSAS